MGTTADFERMQKLELASGTFLPEGDMERGAAIVVLGHTVARELFGAEAALGQTVRISGSRMRVAGVLAERGTQLGLQIDETVFAPVATVMQLANETTLTRVMLDLHPRADQKRVIAQVRALLTERHDEEDFTCISQDAVMSSLSSILRILTLAVAGIAAISLAVAGIGIMNVMLVSVSERTEEVGLLKAIGANRRQILAIFLIESALLSVAGGVARIDPRERPRRVRTVALSRGPDRDARLGDRRRARPLARDRHRLRRLARLAGGGSRSGRRRCRGTDRDLRGADMPRIEPVELLRFSFGTLRGHRLRTFLSMLGIAIGVGAVILLTSLGEGARRYMVLEFAQFGTNMLQVSPGKTETHGVPGALFGTNQKLTIDDSEALARIPILDSVAPIAMGQARVEGNARGRSVVVYGTTAEFPATVKFSIAQGEFLPAGDPRRGASVAVLGPEVEAGALRRRQRPRPLRADRGLAAARDRGHGIPGPGRRHGHRRRGLRPGRDRHAALQSLGAPGDPHHLRPRRPHGSGDRGGARRPDRPPPGRGGFHDRVAVGDALGVRPRDGRADARRRGRSRASRCWSARSGSSR